MEPTVRGTLVTALEGLNPNRLIACAVGCVVSVAACETAAHAWLGAPAGAAAWCKDPLWEARRFVGHLLRGGTVPVALRLTLLFTVLGAGWSLLGGWIARSIMEERFRASAEPVSPGPAAVFVFRRRGSFVWTPILCVLGFGLACMVPLLIGGLHRILAIAQVGAPVVALLLPPLLACALFGVLILCGTLSLPIMPAAIAAEGTDTFDAVSRGFSYFYSRTIRFARHELIALGVAAIPLVLARLGAPGNEPSFAWSAMWIFALGLSLSCFWSAQVAIYLDLRRRVDGVAEGELAVDRDGPAETQARAGDEAGPSSSADWQPAVPSARAIDLGRLALDMRKLFLLSAGLLGLGMAVWLVVDHAPTLLGASGPIRDPRVLLETPALGATAVAVFLLGAGLVLSTAKAAGRIAAIEIATQARVTAKLALAYARLTGLGGYGGGATLALGAILLGFAFLGVCGVPGWKSKANDILIAASAGVLLVGAGSFLLAGSCVGETTARSRRTSPLGLLLGGLPQVLLSGARSLLGGLAWSACVWGIAWGTWTMARECLAIGGGESMEWVRAVSGPRDASSLGGTEALGVYLARTWLLLFFGMVASFPVAYALGWGIATYLRVRAEADRVPFGQVELGEEEQRAIAQQTATMKEADKGRGLWNRLKR